MRDLAVQHQVETPSQPTAEMMEALAQATALGPLVQRSAGFYQRLVDMRFSANSRAWAMALEFYAVLKLSARSNPSVQASLAPTVAMFARGRNGTKEPGALSKGQTKAAAKAVRTLQKTDPAQLADAAAAPPTTKKKPARG